MSLTFQLKEMVMNALKDIDLVFQHLIELTNFDCVFCSTKDLNSGRTQLFLIFNDRRRIYVRHGRYNSWEEIIDASEYDIVRNGFNNAILERKIPCFVA